MRKRKAKQLSLSKKRLKENAKEVISIPERWSFKVLPYFIKASQMKGNSNSLAMISNCEIYTGAKRPFDPRMNHEKELSILGSMGYLYRMI